MLKQLRWWDLYNIRVKANLKGFRQRTLPLDPSETSIRILGRTI